MHIITTSRGFRVLLADTQGESTKTVRLLQESSAVGNYDDSIDHPGSSFLWVGEDRHLNREQVRDLIGHLQYWLDNKRLNSIHTPSHEKTPDLDKDISLNEQDSKPDRPLLYPNKATFVDQREIEGSLHMHEDDEPMVQLEIIACRHGKTLLLTIDEAKELYRELHRLFGSQESIMRYHLNHSSLWDSTGYQP